MKYIGKGIEEQNTPIFDVCEEQIKMILEKILTSKKFPSELGVSNLEVHEKGLMVNFIIEPAGSGEDQYNANIPCTLFIHSDEKSVYIILNEEEEECKKHLESLGEKIKEKTEKSFFHIKIENKKYFEKFKELIPIINNALQELKAQKELKSKKH